MRDDEPPQGQQGLFGTPRHADPASVADAVLRAIHFIAERQLEFSTDEVRDQLRDWRIQEPRQLGPAMKRAQQAGWVLATERMVPSTDPTCHGRRKALWRSRLYHAIR